MAEKDLVKEALTLFPESPYFNERRRFLENQKLTPRTTLFLERIHDLDLSRVCIVTGGDKNIQQQMSELIASIRATRFYKDVPVYILDCESYEPVGILRSSRWMTYHVAPLPLPIQTIKKYDFIKEEHELITDIPAGYQAVLSKPYLDQLIPGYDYYLWINPTFWIQDERGLDEYLSLAMRQGYAASVPHRFCIPGRKKRGPESQSRTCLHEAPDCFQQPGKLAICDAICCIHKDFFPKWRKVFEEGICLKEYDYLWTEKSAMQTLSNYEVVSPRWFSYLYQPLAKGDNLSTIYDYFNPDYPMSLINTKFINNAQALSFHKRGDKTTRDIYLSTRHFQYPPEPYSEIYQNTLKILTSCPSCVKLL